MQSLACNSKWLAVTLSSEGVIASISFGAEQFTGYSAEELVGRPITQILADSSAFEVPLMLKNASEWGHWEGELVHATRSGKLLEARGAVASLAGAGSRSEGYLLLSNLNDGLVPDTCDNAAVAEVARTLRTFAHDLNNPLAVIMGFTQLLILNASSQGKVRNDLDKLYSELKRVIHLVEKLHGYAISLYDNPPRTNSSAVAG